ncbi:hypothetical protein RUM44_005698 [Polyplax serrata]|uniref:Uncharacterized protein n=1 Tax=Polyplax serrata TaxID=468196 RepID=A0ABR1AXV6_POLSC
MSGRGLHTPCLPVGFSSDNGGTDRDQSGEESQPKRVCQNEWVERKENSHKGHKISRLILGKHYPGTHSESTKTTADSPTKLCYNRKRIDLWVEDQILRDSRKNSKTQLSTK